MSTSGSNRKKKRLTYLISGLNVTRLTVVTGRSAVSSSNTADVYSRHSSVLERPANEQQHPIHATRHNLPQRLACRHWIHSSG